MSKWVVVAVGAALLASRPAMAAEYRVEVSKTPSTAGGLSAAVAAQLSPTGFKVLEGDKRVVCEIWLAKQWSTKPDFQPDASVQYGIEPGSLIGALRFPRKGADFRGQDIPAGMYTLRYANQPVDGNHVGTFATRDFLLLVPAAADQSPQPVAEMDLMGLSAQSAESSHPAIMPLVKAEQGPAPAMRHLEEQDWWTVRLAGKDAKGAAVALEVIAVGKAAE